MLDNLLISLQNFYTARINEFCSVPSWIQYTFLFSTLLLLYFFIYFLLSVRSNKKLQKAISEYPYFSDVVERIANGLSETGNQTEAAFASLLSLARSEAKLESKKQEVGYVQHCVRMSACLDRLYNLIKQILKHNEELHAANLSLRAENHAVQGEVSHLLDENQYLRGVSESLVYIVLLCQAISKKLKVEPSNLPEEVPVPTPIEVHQLSDDNPHLPA